MSTYALLALAAASAASASVLELPVVIQNTYASVELQIGTPSKPYRLLLDTGSATSWITSVDCTDISCPNLSGFNRTRYSEAESSTSHNLDQSGDISYTSDITVSGSVIQDVFTDYEESLEWNQTFLAANQSLWRFPTVDGFLGLAFSSIAVNKTTTLVETLLWDHKLDAPRFGLFYGTNLKDTGVQDGVLSIGASHENKYVDGEIAYVPLLKESPRQLWRAPLRSVNILSSYSINSTVTVHNGQLPTNNDPAGTYPKFNTTWPTWGAGRAVFDSGVGRISVPTNIVDAVYFNLGWNRTKLTMGLERMECRHMNASWALSFTFGADYDESSDVTFTLRGDEFYAPGEQCMPPIDDSEQSDFALIGQPLLRRHYSIFDFGASDVEDYAPRVGLGRLKEEFDYLYAAE
ncbi:hypothetical protein DSL72_009492 [Monilinia vaccinii-corymbosi]|uniref:Peptidase A1 domain-containing protein n=1 Tax=Monilinia vaccinii-corymbosi TaxID=61207 RepID=A0A8A3PR82_9HELO|nr:hypothetical protein DSL72_009492 [Monilinia vaccinii-corymbosi]